MNKEKFLKEIKDNTLEELELIYETQKDLYSEEELELISNKINEIKSKEQEKIKEMLPKEIECPKCSGPNSFDNDTCAFCGYKLDKKKYYSLDYYNNLDNSTEENNNNERSYTFQYIISFLIPLIGFILGANLLSKDNDEEIFIGKQCIILGIVSIIVYVILILII